MPDQAKAISNPWRRFLRFSMRGLIVMVLVSGLGLGWLVCSARIQREAVAAITAAGGSIEYGGESSNPLWVPASLAFWAPASLVNLSSGSTSRARMSPTPE
jgi:hypothetical protein